MKNSDVTFSWCVFFSFVVGCFSASALTVRFFPASASNVYAALCYFVLSAIFISLQLYVANIVVPRRGDHE